MAQLRLHGLIDARIMEADLSVTSDGQLQPTKKVGSTMFYLRETYKNVA
jgi:hypothetical protein